MRWMKFTDTEGDTVWLNMSLAESFYRDGAGEYTRIIFNEDREWGVTDAPEEIIARGQWEVR